MLKKYLMIFLVSMVPLIELRGAVPIAVGMNLPLLPSYIICILGNMLPVPIIFFFARKVLEWGADKPVIGKFFTFCLEKGHKGGQKLQEKAGRNPLRATRRRSTRKSLGSRGSNRSCAVIRFTRRSATCVVCSSYLVVGQG